MLRIKASVSGLRPSSPLPLAILSFTPILFTTSASNLLLVVLVVLVVLTALALLLLLLLPLLLLLVLIALSKTTQKMMEEQGEGGEVEWRGATREN